MDKQLLIKFRNNYADEFDVNGFVVLSESEWETHKKLAAKRFDKVAQVAKNTKPDPITGMIPYSIRKSLEVRVYFGTNEDIVYNDLEDYLNSFTITELTSAQYETLKSLFGIHHNGYSYEYNNKTIVIQPRDTITNGMVCLLSDEDEDEDEEE